MPPAATVATDDIEISAYEKLRLEKIAKNNAKLKSLGLDQAKKHLNGSLDKKKKKKKKKRSAVARKIWDHVPERRSTRLNRRKANSSAKLVMLSYAHEDATHVVQQLANVKMVRPHVRGPQPKESKAVIKYIPRSNAVCRQSGDRRPLTAAEKTALSKIRFGDYIPKFEQFMCLDGKLSRQNFRKVICQVSKLARGDGIHYDSPKYAWPTGCYFRKGSRVTPQDDIFALMEEAKDCEDRWGRDHGNGWLLSHPLGKLHAFQHYVLKNPDFIDK